MRRTLPQPPTCNHIRVLRDPFARRRVAGFTIVELGIVLVLLAILITMAAPSFKSLHDDNTRRVALDEMRVAIAFARSESMRRVGRVTLCESSDGENCTGNPGAKPSNGHLEAGWLVFHDRHTESEGTGRRGVVDRPGGNLVDDQPLRHFRFRRAGGQTMSLRDGSSTKGVGYLSFNNRGLPVAPTPSSSFAFPLRLYFCDRRGKSEAVRVDLSAGGALSTMASDTAAPRCAS